MSEKRNRKENRMAHTAAVHKIVVAEIVRVFISRILHQIDGVNRDDARKVARIIDEFGLENFEGIKPEDMYKENEYELSGYEINFLRDQLEALFTARKVQTEFAKAAILLDDLLRDALEKPLEKPLEQQDEED